MEKNQDFKDKVVFITGASGTIGKVIATLFLNKGSKVAVFSRSIKMTIVDEWGIDTNIGELFPLKGDITDFDQINSAITNTIDKYGKIDALINCAGIIGPIGPIEQNSIDDWVRTINTNLIGIYFAIKTILPFMLEAKRGKIINFSGGGAAYGRENFSAYSASKAGVVRLTESVSMELFDKNIQINAIAPGAILSKMWSEVERLGNEAGEMANSELTRLKQSSNNPIEPLLDLIKFLLTEKSNFLTGKLISAKYDDWKDFDNKQEMIRNSDLYTLRRMDAYTLSNLSKYWSYQELFR